MVLTMMVRGTPVLVVLVLSCWSSQAFALVNDDSNVAVGLPKDGIITCFGDSWAAFACDSLEEQAKLHLKKNKVVNKGVPGSTASVWASNTEAMIAQIVSGGIPEFIWLSIGGNDILDGWNAGACVGNASTPSAMACYKQILNDTTVMLEALFKIDPVIQVVQFGYDFPNWVATTECVEYASKVFHGDASQLNANERFMAYEKNVLQPLAAKFPSFSYTHPTLWGTLQQHGGEVGEPVPGPYPNLAFPSPAKLMNDGCIHASKEGWNILMGALWESYFSHRT